jgi:hypothetical protein
VDDEQSRSRRGGGGEGLEPGGGQARAVMHVEFDEPGGLVGEAGQG